MPLSPELWVLAATHLTAGFIGGVVAGRWAIPWVVDWWAHRKRADGR